MSSDDRRGPPGEGYVNPTLENMPARIPDPPEAVAAHTLPMARFDMLTRVSRRNADLSYGDKFGMSLRECFCLSLIASAETKPFKQFCIETGLDKAQGSRAAARLIELGYAEKSPTPKDMRSFDLVATPAGRKMNRRYLDYAAERNRQLLSGLTRGQREVLLESVELVIAKALELNAELQARRKDDQAAEDGP
jgi:DNA-binding MarR family transcriptional regulator